MPFLSLGDTGRTGQEAVSPECLYIMCKDVNTGNEAMIRCSSVSGAPLLSTSSVVVYFYCCLALVSANVTVKIRLGVLFLQNVSFIFFSLSFSLQNNPHVQEKKKKKRMGY